MTIASALNDLNQDIQNARTAITNKGGTVTSGGGSSQLATDIATIPSGTTPTGTISITANGTYDVTNYASADVNVSGGGGGYSEFPSYQVSNGVASRRSGVLTGTEFSGISSVDANGLYYAFAVCSGLTGTLDLSSLTSVGDYGLYYAFRGCSGLTSVDLSSLTSVGNFGLQYAFYGCSGLTGTLDLSSLTSVGDYGLNNAFRDCSGLTSVDLSSLTSVGDSGLQYAFRGCSGLTSVDFSSLTSVGDSGLQYAFRDCSGLTSVDFSSLKTITGNSLRYLFYGCSAITDVYFRALTTTSFGNVNAFNNMMQNTGTTVTHTIHFPSNLQSTISGLTGYPLFGGTSGYVVCAFDLPATS